MKTVKLNLLQAKTVKNNAEVIFANKQKMAKLKAKYEEYIALKNNVEMYEDMIKNVSKSLTNQILTSEDIIKFEKVETGKNKDGNPIYQNRAKWIYDDMCVPVFEEGDEQYNKVNNIDSSKEIFG